MAASATSMSMAHERKVENLRAYMMNLTRSRGFSFPETKLFEQKFVDLCLSRTPDHPTYSAMIIMAIMDLNEEGGSCEEAISEFIKLKYKNLPFAHRSLLSRHLAKLVEKREIVYDYRNYCYSLPGEKEAVAPIDAERTRNVIMVRTNDHRVRNEVMTRVNEEESVEALKFGNHKVGVFEVESLNESQTSLRHKACWHTEDNGVEAGLRDPTVDTLMIEGVAEEPEVALENSESEGRIQANCEEGELHEVVVLYEQNDVLIEDSNEEVMETNSKQRTSNMMEEACVEEKSEAYKKLWECQNEACFNIIALEKLLKQCREKDQQTKAVSETTDVSHLPLSMESCKELWKVAQKIQLQLSEIIDSPNETMVPGCENTIQTA